RFSASESLLAAGVRSLAAAPLLDEEQPLGMIAVGSRVAVRAFSEEDLELLVSLASVASLRLRNVKLAEEAAQRKVLEKEIALARRIQIALLPAQLPDLPGWSLHAGTKPSRTVSGDYYQLLLRGEDGEECVIVVADVSGKGVAASLLTASIEALTAGPIEDGRPPREICDRVARLVHRRTPPEKYATAFVAALEPETGVLRYVNAGHNPPFLVRRDGEVELLRATGTPLGLIPDVSYGQEERRLEDGDLLVAYTDGAIEVVDPDDEEFGEERLKALCRENRQVDPESLARTIEDALREFSRGTPLPDDLTLVMARRDSR
ncbi:MAG: PP2C family protein-serine/threonine phosphatase, partial [Thermoanaerobaculia bacterium]|nr:PP2C family protein-serine/threonine phosphatase [Thermoanaerobaculia bacterium]